ncbi:MAG: DUF5916 domain-containing protein [Saprospiraceae bacterium]
MVLLIQVATLYGQTAKTAGVIQITQAPTIDGVLDEAMWQDCTPAKDFWDNFPGDSTLSKTPTEIYFASDGEFLYVAAKCYSLGDDYVVPSLRRDYRAGGNDNITVVFDPFMNNRNAFVFGMNPLGVTREALISNGGESGRDFQEAWDNKWVGESQIFDGYWTCEMAIPLRSVRYPNGAKKWGFNSYRFDTQSNTRSSWNRIPRNQVIMSLAYTGALDWEQAPAGSGGAATLIPYLASGAQRDYENEPNGKVDFTGGIGGDAKLAVTSGLNLDLTINPDFSQVEVDRQVLNLTRFELSFPERRQFFLENADLFGSFGFGRVNPFFSRRIGITVDTATGEAISNPIYFGARLSGQLNEKWRLGLLNMQTQANKENGLPSYNYTVAALQRQVGARSSLGLIAVNKENFTNFSDSTSNNLEFNRVLGVDFNLNTPDNKWTGKTFLHTSLSPKLDEQEQVLPQGGTNLSPSHGLFLRYRTRNFDLSYDHSYVAEDYNAEVGFVPRTNIFTLSPEINVRFFPKKGIIAQHGPTAETRIFFDAKVASYTDQRTGVGYRINFLNTSQLRADLRHTYILLSDDFDPTRTDATALLAGTDYSFSNAILRFNSDRRKKFSYQFTARTGQFFNGTRNGVDGSLTYRFQPYGNITLNTAYSYVNLPSPYASTGLFLVGPRLDLTFTKSLFLTAVAQYNDQLDNLNTNVRFQWRYAPVSDLFIVYSENYDTFGANSRNRSIVAKLTYWFNT